MRGLKRDGESVPHLRPYVRGLERDGESVPCLRPYVRGLERDGESVPRPRPYVRGLEQGGESVLRPRPYGWDLGRVGKLVRGGPDGPAEPRPRWGLAGGCLLALILIGSKRFFRFLLRGPLFMVPDSYLFIREVIRCTMT